MNALASALASFASLILLGMSPASARDAAPLPDGFKPSSSSPKSPLRGIFAHATYSSSTAHYENDTHEGDRSNLLASCAAKGRTVTFIGDDSKMYETTYWLYRTQAQDVVFKRGYVTDADAEKCTETLREVRSISHRVFLDGRIHEVSRSARKNGGGRARLEPADDEEGPWPWKFQPDEFPSCSESTYRRCTTRRILGVRARCNSGGDGFIGGAMCVSVAGPTRGLLLLDTFQSDDGQSSNFEVHSLNTNADIDRSVFDPELSW